MKEVVRAILLQERPLQLQLQAGKKKTKNSVAERDWLRGEI